MGGGGWVAAGGFHKESVSVVYWYLSVLPTDIVYSALYTAADHIVYMRIYMFSYYSVYCILHPTEFKSVGRHSCQATYMRIRVRKYTCIRACNMHAYAVWLIVASTVNSVEGGAATYP